jgi:fructose-1,6-bisphosphatase-3
MIQAKLTLPKRRIHIISDVHGDDRKLRHVVNNASGGLSNLLDEVFGEELTEAEKRTFLAFLYYPVEKMRRFQSRLQQGRTALRDLWCSPCNLRWLSRRRPSSRTEEHL